MDVHQVVDWLRDEPELAAAGLATLAEPASLHHPSNTKPMGRGRAASPRTTVSGRLAA